MFFCCVSGWQRIVCYLDNANHFLFGHRAFRPLCDLHDRNLTALMTAEIEANPREQEELRRAAQQINIGSGRWLADDESPSRDLWDEPEENDS